MVKEVRLLALQQRIQIHQYLNDWLISSTLQSGVPQTNSKTVKVSEGFGLCSEPQDIEAGTLPEI